jgi:hypothetical protein
LRYDYTYVRLPTFAGNDAFGVHGLHAHLGWTITERLKGSLRRLERATGVELALPFGVLVGPAGGVASRPEWWCGSWPRFGRSRLRPIRRRGGEGLAQRRDGANLVRVFQVQVVEVVPRVPGVALDQRVLG